MACLSAEPVKLAERQLFGGRHCCQNAVDVDIEGLGVNLDLGHGSVKHHIGLGNLADAMDGVEDVVGGDTLFHAVFISGPGDKAQAGLGHCLAETAIHRAHDLGLGSRQRGVGVAHVGPVDESPFDDHFGLGAEESRLPQHEVGHLTDCD